MPDPTRKNNTKIISVVNQKGGVGKTTTTVNLAAALVELGKRVLIVDLDPQGNATTGLGFDKDSDLLSTYDLILAEAPLQDVVLESAFSNLYLIPATTDLSSADVEMVSNEKRSFLLHDAIRQVSMDNFQFDYILIDCPPSLNILTVNAMIASDFVLVPLQAEFYALEGLSQLLKTLRDIRQSANRNLRIAGIVITMFDKRNNLAKQVEQDARDNLGELVFDTVIPRNVRISEAPSYGMPVLDYEPRSKGSRAYRALAKELLKIK